MKFVLVEKLLSNHYKNPAKKKYHQKVRYGWKNDHLMLNNNLAQYIVIDFLHSRCVLYTSPIIVKVCNLYLILLSCFWTIKYV